MRSGMEAKELGELLKDNGLIDESRYELDDQGKLVIYYKASQEGIDTINNYIKD